MEQASRQSLLFPRLIVKYSWWRRSLWVIVMASSFTHIIFDPFSFTWTQWVVDKVKIEHSLDSVLICDIHSVRFPIDCSQAAVYPYRLIRVRWRPHSEGCSCLIFLWLNILIWSFHYFQDQYFKKKKEASPIKTRTWSTNIEVCL